ncbi:hypothetical protein VUJ46_08735 [Chryseobacterium sp. MYb264]|uniref:hypothetical protein n=1 Tax=Chryseobacterium sp. MYb264 TaxID=2745153 RepID=UPI002E102E18|nr:hypothetical protein VUJ46_08735 [Chryseobacterium sp. MYb264]
MKLKLSFLLIFSFSYFIAQDQITKELVKLKSNDFDEVTYARQFLIQSNPRDVIPELIEMLKDTTLVKLENTGDLIYPGAKEFYGHGSVVKYDIDKIYFRAAWILEELTFQDFGYLNDKSNSLILYKKSHMWWKANEMTWSRYSALKEALQSYEIARWESAIHYLRFSKEPITDLNLKTYNKDIKPLIERIYKNTNDESSSIQAKYLLDDDENYWLKLKTKKIKP